MLVESGRTEEVSAIRKAITNAQNEVDKINGIVPESVAHEDHKKIQSIVSDWYAERQKAKEAGEKIRHAESKLETTPDDGRALGDAIRGQNEKAEAENRLAIAEREAELILNNKTPNPVRDEGVHHTDKETIEEKNFLNRRRSERVAPGIFGLNNENEEMQNEMDVLATGASEAPVQQTSEPATINETSVEEKIMKQELPPLEFTLEPTDDEKNLSRVEDRIKEVATRQAELEAEPKGPFQKSEIGEEIAELAKEMSSLEQRRSKIESKKPLQSAYDVAMDRLWKENEAKRNATLENTNEETVVSAGSAPEPEDDSLLPITTVENEEVVGTPKEGQEAAFEKFESLVENKVTREQVLANIAKLGEMAEARAEEKKVPEGWLRRVGDTWNKIPTRYKVMISAGMIVSGLAVETAAATAAVASIGAGLRFIGGTGLFATFDKMLEKRAGKKGVERSSLTKGRDKLVAATFAIVIAGVLPSMARDYAVEHGLLQKISDFFGFGGAHVEAPVESGEYIQIAKNGDSVWKMAGSIVAEKFPDLSPEQKTYVIDAIKDRIEKDPGSYGLADINKITVGKGVDFGGIFGDKEFMDNALSSAKNLTPEHIANIQNYGNETPARTMSNEEFLNEPLHTTFAPEEVSAHMPQQVIPTPEQAVATPEVPPKDVLMEGVIHEASEQNIPTSFIKSEILPGDIGELAHIETSADAILFTDMDILFGESKFLGFGHTDGINSINWKDPQVGFGGKTVVEILNANPSTIPSEGGRTFGIENSEATSKMKSYLLNVTSMTGVNPNSNEKVVDFIRRASVAKLSK
ncbi:MAG: hypothetical protein UW54_C0003G0016 [Parcubacteria group bacterium GW2011_GWC1_44_26]|nr:MAG: hypothetical protein UW54_C0003G0016 [Parcubacteria group bacterium GW2011_GWC1_44_26]